MGLHEQDLTGRTQQDYFNPEEAENYFYDDMKMKTETSTTMACQGL